MRAAIVYGLPMPTETLTIPLPDGGTVSGLWQAPADASVCLALAHGAGAGMAHRSMAAIANGLEALGVATLRYQFPYMENGKKRPDRPDLAHKTIRAAVETAQRLTTAKLFAGGKSFGARMTSQAQALSPLPGVKGLIFLGFPLHPAKKPSTDRATHLSEIAIPMLFLQGDRDTLADLNLLRPIVKKILDAKLNIVPYADHSFHVPVSSGKTDAQILNELLDTTASWMHDPDA